MAHAYLCDDADLELHGLASAFLEQFTPRALEVKISTAGAIGTMAFQWRRRGESAWSEAIASIGSAPWTWRLSEAYATLTFATASYVADTTYTISESGAVTLGAGAVAGLSAERFNLRDQARRRATDDALGWMSPKMVPPLLAWGSDIRSRVARISCIYLKKLKGVGPGETAPSDAVLLDDEDRIANWFQAIGKGDVTPQDFQDSTSLGSGADVITLPVGDDLEGW